MREKLVPFMSLFFAGLGLGPSLAHLLALPNKRAMRRRHYAIAQRAYRGWQWVGLIALGQLAATGAQAVHFRREGQPLRWALLAAACLAGAQGLFWAVTFPANRRTRNWTKFPAGWRSLRRRWEYSHAASALLGLAAHAALTASALTAPPEETAIVR